MIGRQRLMMYTPIAGTHIPITVFDEGGSILGAMSEIQPCEHGNYAQHIVQGAAIPGDLESDWCDGKPEGEQL